MIFRCNTLLMLKINIYNYILVKNNQFYHSASAQTESDICALDVYPTMHLLIQREKASQHT